MTSSQPNFQGQRSSLSRVEHAVQASGAATHSSARDQFFAQCPLSGERTGSLHVTWTETLDGGKVLMRCFSCDGDTNAHITALGLTMSDLFDEPLPERRRTSPRAGRSQAQRQGGARRGKLGPLPARITGHEESPQHGHKWADVLAYDYADLNGQLIQRVIRRHCRSCEPVQKSFRQEFIDESGAAVGKQPDGFVPVLYRLPELVSAIARSEWVYLVEGEKDADRVVAEGAVATTNAGGGKGFPARCAEWLRGAKVRIVVDRDLTGWLRGVTLSGLLEAVASEVQILAPRTSEAKSDLSDHLDAGFALLDLLPMTVGQCRLFAAAEQANASADLVTLALAEVQAQLGAAGQVPSKSGERQDRQRFARRWAAESQIRFEQLTDAVREAQLAASEGSGDLASTRSQRTSEAVAVVAAQVAAATELAGQLLSRGRREAARAHDLAGVAVPPPLQTHPREDGASTSAAAAGDNVGDDTSRVAESGRGLGSELAAIRTRSLVQDSVEDNAERGMFVVRPRYLLSDGAIVEIKKNSDGVEKAILVLGIDARITATEFLEDPRDEEREDRTVGPGRDGREVDPSLNARESQIVVAYSIAYTDPTTGEVMHQRILADEWRSGSWLEMLPGNPAYDSRPAGIAKVRDAVKAISGEGRRIVRHRSTGWRLNRDESWRFIHGSGAIDRDGWVDAPVLMGPTLSRYDLPNPTADAGPLRHAFLQDSGRFLEHFPTRVAAPLLGHVYRSALGSIPTALVLVGSPGSYKTALAALVMNHWGYQWERRTPSTSMSGNGSTTNALRLQAHHAKDVLSWYDDVAPTKGIGAAQELMEVITRMLYNSETRERATRDGQATTGGQSPRTSSLMTSEVMPAQGSGAQRMFVVPLRQNEISLDDIKRLDTAQSRHGRELLMASMIQWLAGDYPALRAKYVDEVAAYSTRLRQTGRSDRISEGAGYCWAGWCMMLDFLVARGALSEAEAQHYSQLVDAGLSESIVATENPEVASSTGQRVRELLVHAMRTGAAYVEDVRQGDAPPWPLASQLGWRRTQIGVDIIDPKYRMESRGIKLGWVLHEPTGRERHQRQLYVLRDSLEQTLKAVVGQMSERLQIDGATALRELARAGYLIGESADGTRQQVQREIHCEHRRALVASLDLDKLLADPAGPEDDGGDGDGCDGNAPEPTSPTGGPSDHAPAGPQELFDATETVSPTPDDAHTPAASSAADGPAASLAERVKLRGGGVESVFATIKEDFMTSAAIEFSDAAGESLQYRSGAMRPCLLCGQPSGAWFGGDPIHVGCFIGSTAATRQAARTAKRTEQSCPAAELAPAAAVTPTEPAKSAPAQTTNVAAAPVAKVDAAVAVLDADGAWLPDSTRVKLPAELCHVGQVAELAARLGLGCQVTQHFRAPGQIWVTAALLASVGVDAEALLAIAGNDDRVQKTQELTRGSQFVTAALAEGWQLGDPGDALGPWTRVRHAGRGVDVWMVLTPALSQDTGDNPHLAGHPDAATLARRLDKFATAMQAPWTVTGQTTGLRLMRSLRWKEQEKLFAPIVPVPPAERQTTEDDLSWTRVPTAEEAELTYVHVYDRGGSYAAGVASLELGIGKPVHHPDGVAFDKKLPGYWLVVPGAVGDRRRPHPLMTRPRANPDTPVWVTTPTLTLATEWGYEPEILEAYVWAEHGRVLEPWYVRVRDARAALDTEDPDDQFARDMVKHIYTRSIGMMASKRLIDDDGTPRVGYAPDRRHHIIGRARANILRKIAKIGTENDQWPLAVFTDSILYASNDPDPISAWPGATADLGRGLGKFWPEHTGLLADHLKYLNGGGYRGEGLDDVAGTPPELLTRIAERGRRETR